SGSVPVSRSVEQSRLPVATNVSRLRIFDRLGVLSVAVHLDPVLLVGVELVGDTEPNRCSLECIGRGLLVVAARANVLPNHAEDLESRLEGAKRSLAIFSGNAGKKLQRQVPLSGDHAIEPLPYCIRFNVGHEAREIPSVASRDLAILSPGNRTSRNRGGQLRPDVGLLNVGILSC